ncbi:MAG: hypothetical protein AAFQ17_07630, partial [Pseudomonadota bacterium]
ARHAHWNIDTLNSSGTIIAQPDIMPKGTLVGVRCVPLGPTVNPIAGESEALIENSGRFASAPIPGNLHDAQVALRLSQPIDITPGDSCNNCGPDAVYVFAGASQIGQDLDGQDNWVLARDFSGFGTIATLSVDNSFPDGPAVVPIGIQGRDGIYSRQNNADFAFTPFASGATNAEIYFSLRSGGSSGSGDALLIVNNADQDGVQFGISNNNTVTLRGGRFSQVLRETVSLPSGWYSRGEWAELRLTLDLTANGSDGAGTIAFRNLTRGEAAFRDIPGMINRSLEGEVRNPETWDLIECRIDDEAAFTNVAINVDPSDDVACCDVDIAAPFGIVDYLDAVLFYQAFDDEEPLA